jgi:23S rRNA pseudouridine2605 synthase
MICYQLSFIRSKPSVVWTGIVSGLILLTNDGDFAYKMTHPKFYKTKVYQVKLSKPLQSQDQQTINDAGVKLPDGPSQLKLESNDNKGLSWTVKMHEGRNRQIRRTFDALGYEVIKLHRTNFAEYALDDIKPGNFIEINP